VAMAHYRRSAGEFWRRRDRRPSGRRGSSVYTAATEDLGAYPPAESGAGDEVIMSIAGHVSRAMLSRYSHVRMEAKRHALDEIAARQRGR
jgi:hypothetical protein